MLAHWAVTGEEVDGPSWLQINETASGTPKYTELQIGFGDHSGHR